MDIVKSDLPHVHAVMLVPPKHMPPDPLTSLPPRNSFFWVSSVVFGLPSIRDPLNDFRIESFNSGESSLEGLLSYCMKGCLKVPQSYAGGEDLWGVFPG